MTVHPTKKLVGISPDIRAALYLAALASRSLCLLGVVNSDITIELSVIELTMGSRSPAANRLIQTVRSVSIGWQG
jgi:hypothetical protein